MTRWFVLGGLCAGLLLSPLAGAEEALPPRTAKPLSEVLRLVEQQGFAPVVVVFFEHGRWQIEAYKAGQKRALKVDPVSARIISDKQDY